MAVGANHLWVKRLYNCIFMEENVVCSGSGGGGGGLPPLWSPFIFTSGFFFSFPSPVYVL